MKIKQTKEKKTMKDLFSFLPEDIQTEIYLYDPTKRGLFDRTVHQLRFIPVLSQFMLRVQMSRVWLKESWYKLYFHQIRLSKENLGVVHIHSIPLIKERAWYFYWRNKLRPVGDYRKFTTRFV